MKRWGWVGLVVLLATALAGCVRIPTSGPVHSTSPGAQAQEQRPDVGAVPPRKGADLDEIVQGFLHAMATSSGDFTIARQYLTAEAAREWRPHSEAVIYLDVSPRIGTHSASLEGLIVGRLNERGEFSRATAEKLTYDFQVTKVNGEWRIGAPPHGILLRQGLFTRSYAPATIYFFDPAWSKLVPQVIYLPNGRRGALELVAAVLRGPSEWLSVAVVSAAPPGMQALGIRLEEDGRIANISLSREVGLLSIDERRRLATQIAVTLEANRDFRRPVIGMRLMQEQLALPLEEMDSRGVTPLSYFARYAPTASAASTQLFAIAGDRVMLVTDAGNHHGNSEPVSGPLGQPGRRLDSIAVAATADSVALVTDKGTHLWVGPLNERAPTMVATSTKLLRPQMTRFGETWTISAKSGKPEVLRVLDGRVEIVPSPALDGIDITDFRISPDGVRIAVSGTRDGTAVFGQALIIRGGGPLSIDGWRALPTPDSATQVTSIGWKSGTELIVLAAGTTAVTTPVSVMIDGSWLKTATGIRWDATQVTVSPFEPAPLRAAAIGAQGQVWRRVADSDWRMFADKLVFIAYPG